MVLTCRDVKKGETAKYYSDCAVKAVTSQGMDDKQAKKMRERRKEIVGDVPP